MTPAGPPAGVALESGLEAGPLRAHANSNQLQQVLTNLCIKAWHALDGERGCIGVGLEREATPRWA